jgi:hypothetical protein
MTNQAIRAEKGRLVKGTPSLNPAGRPVTGLQSFKDRLTHWLETKTIGDIETIVNNPKKWNKLLSIDALVARRIHEAAQKSGTSDFVALLDRLLGKPAMTADLVVTHELGTRLDAAEKILAADAEFVEIAPQPQQLAQLPAPSLTLDDAVKLEERTKL